MITPVDKILTPIAAMVAECFGRGDAPAAILGMIEAVELNGTRKRNSAKAKRGSRLTNDWRPTTRGLEYATEHGLDGSRLEIEIEKFRNYWTAKSGAGACKVDWEATWRNWILNTMERQNVLVRSTRANGATSHTSAGRSTTGNDATLAGMGRLAGRVVKRREQERGHREFDEGARRDDATLQLDLERGGTDSDRGSRAPTE
jgi:hypothetical protein